ncbi:PLDc N-terminal domain-containing protein [Luteipulveratus sp. YIM 133132]|uniref:PLDc N-terminal domain-containing protein n=1 Tax=Luteipulveratus flavus TaxID=3031728 RepID=UPI0023B0CF7D|nr:PLDc N-terminal domain-containing protein [Luteipulveratus sp. YIM 133132]MDE9365027.1 PLDc N-terminal domain-containing protein [Luteipulveratus sp. YIM 133132]
MARVIIPLLILAVVVYALVDCIQTDESEQQHLPKLVWIALIVLAPPFGAIARIMVGRRRRPSPQQRPSGPRGPDDDPDFLRGL